MWIKLKPKSGYSDIYIEDWQNVLNLYASVAQLSLSIKALRKANLTFPNLTEMTFKGQKYFKLKLEFYLG